MSKRPGIVVPPVRNDFEKYGSFELVNDGTVDEHLLVFHGGIQLLLASAQAQIPNLVPDGLRARLEHSASGSVFPDLFGIDFAERTLFGIWSGSEQIWENSVYSSNLDAANDRGVVGSVLIPDLKLGVVRRPDVEQFMREHEARLALLGLKAKL